MELRNCKECGKLFSPVASEDRCHVCRDDEEVQYQKVKDYLWDNPGATIDEVHEETGVDKDTIIQFVKDDRLIADGIDANFFVQCERCGKEIEKGRYCNSCKNELVDGLTKGIAKKKKEIDKKSGKKDQKMYTSDRIRKRKKE
ncbi:flagellar protein [Halanaerobiaceae bacterium Z-7014]|uniref:Flagellar protein n=1 Tax=Halonatronomonas betaini TaxID=2778430 RepID=A0A931AW36_9FIRM|nr:flagellar protein [Halonatronomonas betaini]MBF8437850.1 flagellar protein [Halonatronomonas betaini]